MSRHRVIGPDDPRYPAAARRLFWTAVKTLTGYLLMGGLVAAALLYFQVKISSLYGFGLVWVFLPVVMWWFSDKIALATTKAVPADPDNPRHKRVMDIVHQLVSESGLAYQPPVYASPERLPNAFATGPIPSKAVVAFTAGLLEIGLSDEEIKAVFAHELAHVKHYDVGINSLLAVLSSLLYQIVNTGVGAWLKTLKFFLPKASREKFVPGILTTIISYAIFWLVQQLTKIIQMFVMRARESAADAGGAEITGNPCALASALSKLVGYVEGHRPEAGREAAFWRGMRLAMFIDPLYDTRQRQTNPVGIWEALKQWWKSLQESHPKVPERIDELEKMNGGPCPVVLRPGL